MTRSRGKHDTRTEFRVARVSRVRGKLTTRQRYFHHTERISPVVFESSRLASHALRLNCGIFPILTAPWNSMTSVRQRSQRLASTSGETLPPLIARNLLDRLIISTTCNDAQRHSRIRRVNSSSIFLAAPMKKWSTSSGQLSRLLDTDQIRLYWKIADKGCSHLRVSGSGARVTARAGRSQRELHRLNVDFIDPVQLDASNARASNVLSKCTRVRLSTTYLSFFGVSKLQRCRSCHTTRVRSLRVARSSTKFSRSDLSVSFHLHALSTTDRTIRILGVARTFDSHG